MRPTHSLLFLLVFFGAILNCLAANTPSAPAYFRSDAGIATKTGPLPQQFDSPTTLVWRAELDPGHSTPFVQKGKIFLTTYRPDSKELATVALDATTAKVLWRRPIRVTQIEKTHAIGSPATATLAYDGQRLFAFFGSYGLVCYDLEGNQIWERRMGPFQDEYGAGSSPIVVEGKVILSQDHDVDNFVMAFDAATGKTLWRTARPEAVRSYSTPVLWTHQGRQEVLVAGALELAAYDPNNGEKLWWKNGLARIVIPMPVPSGDMIYMASWAPGGDSGKRIALDSWPAALAKWDKNNNHRLARAEIEDREVLDRFYRMDLDQSGDLEQKEWERHAEIFQRAENTVFALKPKGRGESDESSVLWKYNRGVPYVATPLLDRGILWMVKDGGLVTKLDAATGRVLQEERLPGIGSYYASPVTGDGKVYFASELGMLSVVANQRDWQVIASHNFREKIYATPIIASDRIFIRTEKALYCYQQKEKQK